MSPAAPIAVDAMGGDNAPGAVVEGAVRAARDGLEVLLVGDEATLQPLLPRDAPIEVVHAPDVVGMDDPATAVRRKPDSSLRRVLELVKEGRASAALSCGNSGALLVGAVLVLGSLEGVERPAFASVLPRADGGRLVLLDAGANVDCRPELLACFALLGDAYARVLGVAEPRVGLLSNGEESSKGNMQVKATLPLLEALPLRVVGNIEPPAALAGGCDVLVCDGFVGNVVLKAVEGAAETVVGLLRDEIRRRPGARLGAVLMRRALDRLRARIAWDAQGGALVLGTRGLVVVGHGRANAAAVHAGIRLAAEAARSELVTALEERLRDR